jgi:suppressor of G2 allele of SKP1
MSLESSVLEQLVEAQSFAIQGLYPLAKERLSEILKTNPNVFQALVSRGHVNLKLFSSGEALEDANAALKLDSNRLDGLLLKGAALFNVGDLEGSLKEIERAKLIVSQLQPIDQRRIAVQLWEQKINAEKTKKTTINTGNLLKKAEEQKVDKKEPTATSPPQAGKITYKWHQTDSRIYIEINLIVKKKDDLKVKIDARRIEVSYPLEDSKNYELNLDLFDEIDVEKSLFNVHLNRVEIQLEKKIKERNWTLLEKFDTKNDKVLESVMPKPINPNQVTQTGHVYPSSSKVKKDWSKIDKEIDEDMKKNKDDYVGEDPLNKFFKEIYSNADENTRKAMVKSFQTSGGTVLSTNWDEVKTKDYEEKDRPDAPAGQEWKKPEL